MGLDLSNQMKVVPSKGQELESVGPKLPGAHGAK